MASNTEQREVAVLVARDDLSLTGASCAAGEQMTKPHLHHAHTDAFYVLEGELTFEIGRETTTVGAGGFVAVPPNVVHSFRNAGGERARWLTIHAPDAGFAAFIRGTAVEWDVSAAG
jgi:mannose-6-phosphate isomerase-like protein (cupin superfamily)